MGETALRKRGSVLGKAVFRYINPYGRAYTVEKRTRALPGRGCEDRNWMERSIRRLAFLFCSLGFMFLAGWEAAKVREEFYDVFEREEMLPEEEAPRVALTFDDGPNREYTPELLDGLKERDVKATFFLMGQNIEGQEELVRRMHREGHLIGNHTFHHVRMSKVSQEEAVREIEKTSNAIYELTGVYTSFIRPPFGEWKKGMDFHVTMIPVMWTIDSRDWVTQDTGQILKEVLPKVEDGSIILMHDEFDASVKAALAIVDELQKKGCRFVTVDELLLE